VRRFLREQFASESAEETERPPLLRGIFAFHKVANERGIRGRDAESSGLGFGLIKKELRSGESI
jgi:hypothetical protein